jgi:hypothetical protein
MAKFGLTKGNLINLIICQIDPVSFKGAQGTKVSPFSSLKVFPGWGANLNFVTFIFKNSNTELHLIPRP